MNKKDRSEIRQRLGLTPADAPVYTVPPLAGRDDGHFRAGWATLLVRKGGVPARLLLSEPNRESRRVVRFAVAALEPGAILVAPKTPALSWQEVLTAADILVVPSQALCDPLVVEWAMSAGLPIVAAGLTSGSPLLDATTCLLSLDNQPLNLARSMLRIWQDKSLAQSMITAAGQRIGGAQFAPDR